ncbi:cupin domain-containing protein [Rhizobium sp. BK650]|uniref:cupin domain-containing protein n=1 Tax=Rhizobium sp. BK650 TaxID=2586990 RepID=UPI0016115FEC
MFSRALLILAAATLSTHTATASDVHGGTAKISIVFDRALPNVPGKSMKGVLVEYGPGGSSSAHIHPKSAFIYATVLTGAIKSKVNDGPETVYKAGENFSELPGDRHGVSANASATEPASLLAVFVVDTNETNLVTDIDP